jgi:hypothetical protein
MSNNYIIIIDYRQIILICALSYILGLFIGVVLR